MADKDRILRKIRAHGDKRREALDEAETELREIEKLVPDAVKAGIPLTEISAAGAVSRPHLYKLPGVAPKR
jgi:hypothetical protein